jgi:hypothetical protein
MSRRAPDLVDLMSAMNRGRPIEKVRDEDGDITALRIVELQGYSPAQNARWFGDGIARNLLTEVDS